MIWTKDRIERLKTLWAEGWSAAQIAGRFGDISRSAVLGKARRLGLASRSDTSRQRIKVKTREDHSNSGPSLLSTEPAPKRIPLLELRHDMCRWPYGDPKQPGFGFCGHKQVPGLSYCTSHARRAFRFNKRRR